MKLKTLTTNDIPAILELDGSPEPNYVKIKKEELEFIFSYPETCCALGIFDGEKLVAWGTFFTDFHDKNKEKGVYEIYALYVHKQYRKKGLAKKLLLTLIKRIKTTQNYKEIYLDTSPYNVPALFLYIKTGFIITDFKRDFYGPGLDRVFLSFKGN